MSQKTKGAGKTASKSKPKNSSRNSRLNSSLNSKKRPFNITRAFLAVFVLVMLAWIAALMMIKEEPQAKKANLAQNNNTQKIHELLESKKKKSSVLDEQNSSQKISKDNKIANIYEEISDEKLKEFSKKLQEQKEEFIAKTLIEQNISEQNASKEQSTFEKTAEQAPNYSYSANSHSKRKSHKAPNGGPKLAIIMDDISTNAQVRELKKLSIKVTPSIFPRKSIQKVPG